MTRIVNQWRQALVAVLSIGLGAFAISQTNSMSELGRVFPTTASLIAISAGLGVLVQIILRPSADTVANEKIDHFRAGLFAATMLVWALSPDRFGFVPTSSMAVFAVAVITRREPMSKTSILVHAAAGVVLVLGFSLLLSEVLNVRLP
ncbi:tripartite tricarboxylate transporter TctB family protein [Marivita hallyeonensis]|uniref:Tripartite tricarboxylate transporter TctB family protein n=1 Tax=Marivita hallyeonensis TaxID=996342 RepID=A0A1M5W3C1_9RHOB|nr:tripartite tricarboxylate transporter TctB family protein [Marivita hallyeonensis]SHH82002.1 Tripartite tricarboxylate transporter TctB family protein [Marivita hallyeonensis]